MISRLPWALKSLPAMEKKRRRAGNGIQESGGKKTEIPIKFTSPTFSLTMFSYIRTCMWYRVYSKRI